LNFGINECDDGNLDSGDGCSPTCTIEPGYVCSGGNLTSSDTCTPIPTQLFNLTVTDLNALLLEFDKDVTFSGDLLQTDLSVQLLLLESTQLNGFTTLSKPLNQTALTWRLPDDIYFMLPTRVLYVELLDDELGVLARYDA